MFLSNKKLLAEQKTVVTDKNNFFFSHLSFQKKTLFLCVFIDDKCIFI